jgi:hypothetical protein
MSGGIFRPLALGWLRQGPQYVPARQHAKAGTTAKPTHTVPRKRTSDA